jgi:hypothetical protein
MAIGKSRDSKKCFPANIVLKSPLLRLKFRGIKVGSGKLLKLLSLLGQRKHIQRVAA